MQYGREAFSLGCFEGFAMIFTMLPLVLSGSIIAITILVSWYRTNGEHALILLGCTIAAALFGASAALLWLSNDSLTPPTE